MYALKSLQPDQLYPIPVTANSHPDSSPGRLATVRFWDWVRLV
jgi:hypothetical protein